jgi:hypothetical protein
MLGLLRDLKLEDWPIFVQLIWKRGTGRPWKHARLRLHWQRMINCKPLSIPAAVIKYFYSSNDPTILTTIFELHAGTLGYPCLLSGINCFMFTP